MRVGVGTLGGDPAAQAAASACPAVLIAVVGATVDRRRCSISTRARRVGAGAAAAGPARISRSPDRRRRHRAGPGRRLARLRWCRSPTPACCRAPMPRGLGTRVDPNQEMVGLGAANLAAGFFQGFPISSSSSRTPVAEAAGARTQLTGVVGALAVAFLLLVAPEPASAPAERRAGGGGDRRGDRPVRDRRPRTHLSHPALGVLAVDRLLRRRRGVRRDSRHRDRDRDRRHRVPVGRLAAAFGGARPRRTASRAITT